MFYARITCREAITAASTSADLILAICVDLLIPGLPPPFLLPPPLPPPTLRREEEEEERTLVPPLALRVPPLPFEREEAPPPVFAKKHA